MFTKIEHPSGILTYLNPAYIVKADLHPISKNWKIYIANEEPLETESFETLEAAIQWYEDTIGKVVLD